MDTVDASPIVAAVEAGSCADRAGLTVGDAVLSVNGVAPRDIIEWQRLVDEPLLGLVVDRGGMSIDMEIQRIPGEPFGATVTSAVFDRIHTCDNHCEFCFIYQLPKGMRRSLYTKDDDYRLSFLYGNFTTLTRFTEADLERVVDERLSPLYVSIHSAEPMRRAEMLRNDRGGTSLRWLRQLLDHGIDAHAQVVLCPGVNDGPALDATLHGLLETFPELLSVAVVPLGLSRHNTEARMRVHTAEEAADAVALIEQWQERYRRLLGRTVVHAADELYLRAGLPLPASERYGEFEMLEDGIGIARSFIDAFRGERSDLRHHDGGFFGSVDATAYVRTVNPAAETSLRHRSTPVSISRREPRRVRSLAVVTGELGASVIGPLVSELAGGAVEVIGVRNDYFGGNTAVAGLLTFEDVSRALEGRPSDVLHLIPDVCLNGDRFLDGHTVGDLSALHSIEVVPTSGTALRARIQQFLGGPS